jgi:hypothetical protein
MQFFHNTFLSLHWLQLADMLSENYWVDDSHTVVLGAYVFADVASLRDRIGHHQKIIIYQTEPLVEGHWHKKEKILNNIRGADEVWDYDLQNIEVLRQHGIEAKFRPPAYTNRFRRIPNLKKDIDILFYGSFTDYRFKIISHLVNKTVLTPDSEKYVGDSNIVWLYNITDDKLDEYIGRSKIILNLKPYEEATRQQQTRIYYPLINDKCVLSQKADINYFGDCIHEFHNEYDLQDKIIDILKYNLWDKPTFNHGHWFANHAAKKKIAIFYHVLQTGNWVSIFEEQLVKLQQSGLYDAADYIHIGVNGNEHIPWLMPKVNRIRRNPNVHLEADTMVDMWNFCKANPDYRVLYIHAKGVTHGDNPCIIAWRRYLEHFVIGKWKTCVEKLSAYDCVGTEWENDAHIGDTKAFLPCYAGNFWWANAEYINKLDTDYLFQDTGWIRWQAEFWIGTGNPNYFNFYSSNQNKYGYFIDASEYSHI